MAGCEHSAVFEAGNILEETLTKEGYGVYRAYSGTEVLFVLSQ